MMMDLVELAELLRDPSRLEHATVALQRMAAFEHDYMRRLLDDDDRYKSVSRELRCEMAIEAQARGASFALSQIIVRVVARDASDSSR